MNNQKYNRKLNKQKKIWLIYSTLRNMKKKQGEKQSETKQVDIGVK